MENHGTITVDTAKALHRRFAEQCGGGWELVWRVDADGTTAHSFAITGAQSLHIPLDASTPQELAAAMGRYRSEA